MPSFCAVVNCNDRYGHSENISFHKFPLKRKELLEQWESFIQIQRGPGWRASRWSSLCSRHFREEDFRSLNERKTLKKTAVPSVLEVDNGALSRGKTSTDVTKADKDSQKDKEFKEILAIKEQLEDVATPKTNCRLCGVSAVPVATFSPNNYELYGLLQKCFPTLNIDQDDTLPKVLCSSCYTNLQQFSEFVDLVWTAQAELQKKYKSKAVEKPQLKIKQEPLGVRVKQEVAEVGYDQQQDPSTCMGGNDDYDTMAEGNHEEGDDSVDQKYEFCDFPINDCDIMEIINLDDPFINIPDDDNTTVINENEEIQKPINESVNHLPTAHELLLAHMLMDEHNYAYVDTTEDFKEESQVYKTEKSDIDERVLPDLSGIKPSINSVNSTLYQNDPITEPSNMVSPFENRALKPIVTSVSAIQQPSKSNGIVVLNESIVQSVGGCHLHTCMVCHLKFFSVESLKEHYTQAHGTPMVTVPTSNIVFERNTLEGKCNMKKEIIENVEIFSAKQSTLKESNENVVTSNDKFKMDTMNSAITTKFDSQKPMEQSMKSSHSDVRRKGRKSIILKAKQRHCKNRKILRRNISLNTMASQYHQLRKLYQTLQDKCLNLEQNVEQLQMQPSTKASPPPPPPPQAIKYKKSNREIKLHSNSVTTLPAEKISSYNCPICSKTFPNGNSLRQHSITHVEERKHVCNLCNKPFKRRNGLLQHMRGFHLGMKPYACPVCNHCYALKCDMLRCKHSSLKTNRSIE